MSLCYLQSVLVLLNNYLAGKLCNWQFGQQNLYTLINNEYIGKKYTHFQCDRYQRISSIMHNVTKDFLSLYKFIYFQQIFLKKVFFGKQCNNCA